MDYYQANPAARGGTQAGEARPLSDLFQPRENLYGNAYVKTYPDGTKRVIVADRAIFRAPGWQDNEKPKDKYQKAWQRLMDAADEAEQQARRDRLYSDDEDAYEAAERGAKADEVRRSANLDRAKRRAKSNVRDLAYSNNFRYFVTLTLDGEKINRYDIAAVTKKLNQWLSDRVKRDGLTYVLVAERHKDGAIHFHGFVNDRIEAKDSGTITGIKKKPAKPRSKAERERWLRQGGHVVYNLPRWTLGFTTAVQLYGDRNKAIGYVCKYITKAQEKVGGRWYYSGGDLQRPYAEVLRMDYDACAAMEGVWPLNLSGIGAKAVTFIIPGDGETGWKASEKDDSGQYPL